MVDPDPSSRTAPSAPTAPTAALELLPAATIGLHPRLARLHLRPCSAPRRVSETLSMPRTACATTAARAPSTQIASTAPTAPTAGLEIVKAYRRHLHRRLWQRPHRRPRHSSPAPTRASETQLTPRMVCATMVDPEQSSRTASSAPTAGTADLERRQRRRQQCQHPLFHRPRRLRHHHPHRHRLSRLRRRPRRLRHHHPRARLRHPRARRHSLPDQRSLAGRTFHPEVAGGTLRRGTMRRTSCLTATRRRSHRPTARRQGEWAASPCPGLLVRSPRQESELRSCRRRAP
jgi:hypothetical protein